MPRLKRTQLAHAPARARSLTLQTAQRARRAQRELLVVVPLLAITVYAYVRREELFGVDAPVRVVAAIVIVVLGWALARALGRSLAPTLFRRMDPATAGTVGFLIRLVFLAAAALFALRAAGLKPETLVVGGAITAVVFGLAAQQTLGNLIAGMVLISARPFRVGDRVRLQAGGLAGQVEGVVSSLGLLYTTFAQGQDSIMVPNNVVLTAAVVPLREPAAVDLRARLRPDVRPSDLQALLEEAIQTPVRSEPHISLEEVDRDEVIVRIAAKPLSDADGPRLADEILGAISAVTPDDEVEFEGDGGRGRLVDDGGPGRAARDFDTPARDEYERREQSERLERERRGERLDDESPGLRSGSRLDGERDGRRRDPITQEYES
jgi:small conductance mechanosensitive channel